MSDLYRQVTCLARPVRRQGRRHCRHLLHRARCSFETTLYYFNVLGRGFTVFLQNIGRLLANCILVNYVSIDLSTTQSPSNRPKFWRIQMNAQETLNKTSTIDTTVPATPAVAPEKRRNELLESIAEDCLINAKDFVAQSKAPEGEQPESSILSFHYPCLLYTSPSPRDQA